MNFKVQRNCAKQVKFHHPWHFTNTFSVSRDLQNLFSFEKTFKANEWGRWILSLIMKYEKWTNQRDTSVGRRKKSEFQTVKQPCCLPIFSSIIIANSTAFNFGIQFKPNLTLFDINHRFPSSLSTISKLVPYYFPFSY